MNNCHISDEFATIESGLIHNLNGIKDIDITNCSIKSNTKQSAFISSDWLSTSYKNTQPDNTIKISYCSNYGDTSNLITVAACDYNYSKVSPNGGIEYYNNQNIIIDNIVNYGFVSSSLFTNDVYVYEYRNIRTYTNNFRLDKVLNFGTIGSFIDVVALVYSDEFSKATDRIKNTFTINSCFNAGATTNASFNFSNYSQINSDFFINTIGLNPERWDLSYINIQDEYGLPTIIY